MTWMSVDEASVAGRAICGDKTGEGRERDQEYVKAVRSEGSEGTIKLLGHIGSHR